MTHSPEPQDAGYRPYHAKDCAARFGLDANTCTCGTLHLPVWEPADAAAIAAQPEPGDRRSDVRDISRARAGAGRPALNVAALNQAAEGGACRRCRRLAQRYADDLTGTPRPPAEPPPVPEVVDANLASLNEIVSQMMAALVEHGIGDSDFAGLVRTTLRDHSWALGFDFEGERPR